MLTLLSSSFRLTSRAAGESLGGELDELLQPHHFGEVSVAGQHFFH